MIEEDVTRSHLVDLDGKPGSLVDPHYDVLIKRPGGDGRQGLGLEVAPGPAAGDGPTSSNGSSRADDELTPSPGDELTPSTGDELTPSSGSGRGIWVGGTGGASQAVPERLDSVEF